MGQATYTSCLTRHASSGAAALTPCNCLAGARGDRTGQRWTGWQRRKRRASRRTQVPHPALAPGCSHLCCTLHTCPAAAIGADLLANRGPSEMLMHQMACTLAACLQCE